MEGFSRRQVIGAAGAIGGLATAASMTSAFAEGEEPPFGPAPPVLDKAELPSFRYAMGEQPAKPYDGGWAKEATVAEFPVSEKLAGVLMQLSPGALRELHWHANAAEWAYVLKGSCRVSTIDPEGHAEVIDVGPGDVWYFPRGHGHSIEGIGADDCLFLLVFDNGYFSEFGTFSISDWIAHTPPDVLARNFGVPAATFADFPKSEVYMAKGPVPGPLPANPAPGSLSPAPLTHRYRLLAQEPKEYPGGSARLVSVLEFPISQTMTGSILTIKPGGMREMHWHPNAAEWQYYIAGSGQMTVFGSHGRARTETFGMGDVGYVPQGYGHYIENTGAETLEVLIVLNSGLYQAISITDWMARTPPARLVTNFRLPETTFANFPKGRAFMP